MFDYFGFFALFSLTILSIFYITKQSRSDFELKIKQKYNIDRELWVPIIFLLLSLSFSLIEIKHLYTAIVQDLDILLLIFSFGFLAEGVRSSGLFRFVAYKTAKFANGNVLHLVVFTFIATSILTFFTTNDIVILVLTPIIIEIGLKTGIKNMKLLLISQFIAANTFSAGMIFGSPTNIILSEKIGLGFFSYLSIMGPISVITTSITIIFIILIFFLSNHTSFLDEYKSKNKYNVGNIQGEEFNSEMLHWIIIFGLFLSSIAIVTVYKFSFILPSLITIGFLSVYFIQYRSTEFTRIVTRLPFSIFSFGIAFFTVANSISDTSFTVNIIIPAISSSFATNGKYIMILSSIFGSGLLVNLVNDLPASAIISENFPYLLRSTSYNILLIQSTLIGLNIGTYVSKIGALAGLIWFNHIRVAKNTMGKNSDLSEYSFPVPADMIRIGGLCFLFTGGLTSIILFIM